MNSLYINTNKLINKNNGIEWKVSKTLVAYSKAIKLMEKRVENIHKNISPEMIWLLQHPPIYTCVLVLKILKFSIQVKYR